MQSTTKLTLTLEWFLNPDHLPFIAGVTTGAYQQAGLDITIIEPDDHYDGFAELQNQTICTSMSPFICLSITRPIFARLAAFLKLMAVS